MGGEKKINEAEILMLLIIAVIGRVILEPFPSIEPIIPIAVYAGLKYGANSGTIIGLLGYPISNIFMNGGPFGLWTFWQAITGAFSGAIAEYGKELTTDNLVLYSLIGTIVFEIALNIGSEALFYWPYSFVHIGTNVGFAYIIGVLTISKNN